jgi:transketolase
MSPSLAGETSMSFSEDVGKRFEAYDWHVQDVGEDLSVENLERAAEEAKGVQDKPSLVIVRSHIGYGSPNKQDTSSAHGSPLGEDEVKLTKEAYGWPADKTFYVPDEARKQLELGGCQTAGTATCPSSAPTTARSPRARPRAR